MIWIKAFHIIFMVTWFAGLFYLPRLFVYHAMCDDQAGHQRFVIMERKLYYAITTPGAVITTVLGLWMLLSAWDVYVSLAWMHAKLALVVFLIAYHVMCGIIIKQFKTNTNRHGHVFYRWFNEVPVLFLVGIVVLAVVRPF